MAFSRRSIFRGFRHERACGSNGDAPLNFNATCGILRNMKGNAKVIEELNKALREELTAINQYFLHAEMCEN
jgi:hypothetical protein